jgi:hypothetical protein
MEDNDNYINNILCREIVGNDKFLFKVFKYINTFVFSRCIDDYIKKMTNNKNIVNIFSIIFELKENDKKIKDKGYLQPADFIIKEKEKIDKKINKILSQDLKNKTLVSYMSDLSKLGFNGFIEALVDDIIKLFTKVIIVDYNNIKYNLKNMNKDLEKLTFHCFNYNKCFCYLPNKIIYFSPSDVGILNSMYLPSSIRILNFLPIVCKNTKQFLNKKSISKINKKIHKEDKKKLGYNINNLPNSVIIFQIEFSNCILNLNSKIKFKLPYKTNYLACDNTNCILNKFNKLKILKVFGTSFQTNKIVNKVDILDISTENKVDYKKNINFDIDIYCNTLFFSTDKSYYKNIKIKNVKNIVFKNKTEKKSFIEIDIPEDLNILCFKGENENSILNISQIPKKINFLHIDNMKLLDIKCHKDNTVINMLSYDNSSNFDDRILSCSENLILNDKENEFIDFYEIDRDKHLFANYDDNYSKSVIKDLITQKLK